MEGKGVWNNILLQSYDYQLKRQNMYEELYSDHEKKHWIERLSVSNK